MYELSERPSRALYGKVAQAICSYERIPELLQRMRKGNRETEAILRRLQKGQKAPDLAHVARTQPQLAGCQQLADFGPLCHKEL